MCIVLVGRLRYSVCQRLSPRARSRLPRKELGRKRGKVVVHSVTSSVLGVGQVVDPLIGIEKALSSTEDYWSGARSWYGILGEEELLLGGSASS